MPVMTDATIRRLISDARARELAMSDLPPQSEWKGLRERNHLSLEVVAQYTGVTDGSVWRWEQGVCRPRGDALTRYARLLSLMAE
jgi:DNA-binding transcriptional regulator YiaG